MKNILTLSVTLLIASQLIGQHEKMDFTFDHYAINVVDMDQSVAFYQKCFFIHQIYDGTEKEHIRWFSLGNNQELHLITVESLSGNIPKGVHIALTTPDLGRYLAYLDKVGVEYYNWPGAKGEVSVRPDNVTQIYLQDPDGYWIEVNDGINRFTK